MNGFEVLIPIFGILLVLVPVTGLTFVLTLRLGGKPFVEALARELRASGYAGSPDRDVRLIELTEQVEALTAEVGRLREAQEFDQRLVGAKESGEG